MILATQFTHFVPCLQCQVRHNLYVAPRIRLCSTLQHHATKCLDESPDCADSSTCTAGEPAWVRAYLPNIIYEPPPDSAASSGSLFSFRTSPAKAASLRHLGIGNVRALVAGIALIATQEVHNEELLLNYRLSPHVSRPSWYTPVDDEEDRRRWD